MAKIVSVGADHQDCDIYIIIIILSNFRLLHNVW